MNETELHRLSQEFDRHKNLVCYDPESWDFFLSRNGYLESNADENWLSNALNKGYHINPGIKDFLLEKYQGLCPLSIPNRLIEFWTACDGFSFRLHDPQKTNSLIHFGLLPMEAALGGLDSLYRMHDETGIYQFLQEPILAPERYEENLEFIVERPSEIDLKQIFTNSIFLEAFSLHPDCFTIYKLDHQDENTSAIHLVLEDGPLPLSLNLESYLETLIDFRGIVFPWPLLFIREDNLDSSILQQKRDLIELAKGRSKDLHLEIDFEKYGL
ncbi:MAG: hypothetical protein EP338_13835 [Bacteroidetes bacterium]|nr:MAG: hypothetical protein EP338_13835 [Bacteroidota bacterium]